MSLVLVPASEHCEGQEVSDSVDHGRSHRQGCIRPAQNPGPSAACRSPLAERPLGPSDRVPALQTSQRSCEPIGKFSREIQSEREDGLGEEEGRAGHRCLVGEPLGLQRGGSHLFSPRLAFLSNLLPTLPLSFLSGVPSCRHRPQPPFQTLSHRATLTGSPFFPVPLFRARASTWRYVTHTCTCVCACVQTYARARTHNPRLHLAFLITACLPLRM